jgi:ferredoxin
VLAAELGKTQLRILRQLPPGPVRRLLDRLEVPAETYVFALAVNAGMPARSLLALKAWLAGRGIPLAAGFSIALPSNYTPWGGPGSLEEQRTQVSAARRRLAEIAAAVCQGRVVAMERGPLLPSLLFSGIYRATYPIVARMDRSFRVDPTCTSCGICDRVCPAGNIELREGRPVWLHRCEQCLACLHWCPEGAIQYGRNTSGRERYHHPEVTLQQILGG